MRTINSISLLVHDYDEAIEFYTEKLGFQLLEDTAFPDSDKRWVVVGPGRTDGTANDENVTSRSGANLLLAKAQDEQQAKAVGNQAG